MMILQRTLPVITDSKIMLHQSARYRDQMSPMESNTSTMDQEEEMPPSPESVVCKEEYVMVKEEFCNEEVQRDHQRDERDEVEEEDDDDMPLDLSVAKRAISPVLSARSLVIRRHRSEHVGGDSGTDSSDESSGRMSPGENGDCKAYKKSLMKRYCKFFFS